MNHASILQKIFLGAAAIFLLIVILLPPRNTEIAGTHLPAVRPQVSIPTHYIHPRLQGLETWVRPAGPLHVGIQIGHRDADQAPDELWQIRKNTGAQHGAMSETAAMSEIATLVKERLETEGIRVTLLPTKIPPNFWADVFISLHADGNANTTLSGYKVASSWYDVTDKGRVLAKMIEENYETATGLPQDPNITANMRGYYGFNWYHYDHSAHPLAVSAIVETGFLTSAADRAIIVDQPEKAARGVANGIIDFLHSDTARENDTSFHASSRGLAWWRSYF